MGGGAVTSVAVTLGSALQMFKKKKSCWISLDEEID